VSGGQVDSSDPSTLLQRPVVERPGWCEGVVPADRLGSRTACALAHITGCLRGQQFDQCLSNSSCVFDGASGAVGIQAETATTK
jgi:hypothetical protein